MFRQVRANDIPASSEQRRPETDNRENIDSSIVSDIASEHRNKKRHVGKMKIIVTTTAYKYKREVSVNLSLRDDRVEVICHERDRNMVSY
jgi:hypothetical protein